MQHINEATRRNYSAHVIRAHLQGFRPLSLQQFAKLVLFQVQGFAL